MLMIVGTRNNSVICNAIDTVNKDSVHFQRSHSKPWVILPNDERVKNPTFDFLDQKWASPKSTNYHFHNCTINFYNGENSVQHQNIIENVKDV